MHRLVMQPFSLFTRFLRTDHAAYRIHAFFMEDNVGNIQTLVVYLAVFLGLDMQMLAKLFFVTL